MKDVLMGDEESIKTRRRGGVTVRLGDIVGPLGRRRYVQALTVETW